MMEANTGLVRRVYSHWSASRSLSALRRAARSGVVALAAKVSGHSSPATMSTARAFRMENLIQFCGFRQPPQPAALLLWTDTQPEGLRFRRIFQRVPGIPGIP